MSTFCERILNFNDNLCFPEGILPENTFVLNPFKGDYKDVTRKITTDFYTKYYLDNKDRHLILGINPGRLGAGLTGVPFTDSACLEDKCKLSAYGIKTRETSAIFVYEMIDAYGSIESFYKQYFIGAMSPLGLARTNEKGNIVNYNYYDNTTLLRQVRPYLIQWLKQQINLGIKTDKVFVLGTGKNTKALIDINRTEQLFEEIVPLEHPRYIMQYKQKQKADYIDKFITALR